MSFISPPLNTPPNVGPPKNPRRGTGTAVIAAVDNPTNPKYVTVLVNNTFPPESGYTIVSPISGSFAAGGTTGFSYFYNNSKGIGGSIVSVDLDNQLILGFTGQVSTSAPTGNYSGLINHSRVGNLNPTTGLVPGAVDTTGSAQGVGNFPYIRTSGNLLTPVTDTGNLIATLFSGESPVSSPALFYAQTVNNKTDSTQIVVPQGGVLFTNWTSQLSSSAAWGPTITDGITTYTFSIAPAASSLLRNGTVIATMNSSAAPAATPATTVTFSLVSEYQGGTSWRFVLYVDSVEVLDFTDGASPMGAIVQNGFFCASTSAAYHADYDYSGSTTNPQLLDNPGVASPLPTSLSSVTYPVVSSTGAIAEVSFTLPEPPAWAEGLRLYVSSGNVLPNPATAAYTTAVIQQSGHYTVFIPVPLTAATLYYAYVDLAENPGSVAYIAATVASPTVAATTTLTIAPTAAQYPTGLSYVLNVNADTYDALMWFYIDANPASYGVASVELVYELVGTSTWVSCGELVPQASGAYLGVFDKLSAATQEKIGVRYLDSAGNASTILQLGTTPVDPVVITPMTVSVALPPAPTVQAGSSSVTAFGTGSLPGVLDDFLVKTTVTNVPADGSVDRVLWAIRKSQDPVVAVNGATVTLVNTFADESQTLRFPDGVLPTPGELVVVVSQFGGSENGTGMGWNVINDPSGDNRLQIFWKIWSSSDTNSEQIEYGFGYTSEGYICYVFTGFNASDPIGLSTFGFSNAGTPATVTTPSVVPVQLSNFVITAVGIDLVDTGDSATVSNGYVEDGTVTGSGQYGGASFLAAAHRSSLTGDLISPQQNTFTFSLSAMDNQSLNSVIFFVNSAEAGQTTGGATYPWTFYDEQDVAGWPAPATVQAIENGFGQVAMGMNYDFALAYVSSNGGVIGPLTVFISNYTSPNKLQIPGNYLLNTVWTPVLANQTVTSVPSLDGVTATVDLSFEVLNQPIDASLTKYNFWLSTTGNSGPWQPLFGIKAQGAGNAPSTLSVTGTYDVTVPALINGQVYYFGLSAESVADGETSIVSIGSTTATFLQIGTQYQLGIGQSDFPTWSSVSVVAGNSANGLSADTSINVSLTNMPTDGSLSRINFWRRSTNPSASVGSGTSLTGWSPEGGIDSPYLNSPPYLATASVQFDYADLTNATVYWYGISYESTTGGETEIAVLGTTTAVEVGIPGQYLLGNVAYVPAIHPGIPAEQSPTVPTTDGVPPSPTAQNAIVQTLYPNGLNAGYLLSFQVTNQPQDGTLSQIVVKYRATSAMYGPTATAAQNPWSYYSSVPAVGVGGQPSTLPTVGNYQINILDLSVGQNQTFDFGIACRDVQSDETVVSYLGTSTPITASPPGFATGTANLVVDADFTAGTFATGPAPGWNHNQVTYLASTWYSHNLNGGCVVSQPGNAGEAADLGNYMGVEEESSGTLFYRISQPITVAPGQTYTISATLNAAHGHGGTTGGMFIGVCDAINSSTYTTVYFKAQQTPGVSGRVSLTFTVPSNATYTQVAVIVSTDAMGVNTGGYIYIAKPMMNLGMLSGYVPGPATPSTGTTATASVALGNADASGTSSLPTVSAGSATSTANPAATTGVPGSIQGRSDLGVLQVAGTDGVFRTLPQSLSQLLDVSETTAPTGGQVLTWNATDSKWEPGTGGSGSLPITTGTAAPSLSAISETGEVYIRTGQSSPTPDGVLFVATGTPGLTETQTQLNANPNQLLRLVDASGSTAADASGNSRTGSFSNVGYGGSPLVADASQSISFNGQNSYCATNYQIPTAAFTVEMFAASSCGNNQRLFANAHTDTDHTGIQIRMGTTGLTIDVGTPGGVQSWGQGGNYQTVQHIVITYDGTYIRVYLNGTLQQVWTSTYNPGGTMPALGYNPAYGGDYWSGTVNNFAVYPAALTAAQVLANYSAEGNTGTGPSWAPVYVGEPTLASDTDIDQTTQGAGKVLTDTPSNGKPFSWQTPAAGGGSGGGNLGLHSVNLTTSYSDGSGPINGSALSGMSITLPAASAAYSALVSAFIGFTGSHNNHFFIFLDGVAILPTGPNTSMQGIGPTDDNPARYSVPIPLTAVAIPGDNSSHTIAVYYSVMDSGAATTFVQRTMLVLVLASGAAASYDSVILAESSLVHYWPLNDTSGSPADGKGSGSLTVSSGGAYYGASPITLDAENCMMLDGTGGLTGSNALIPNLTTGPWCVEFIALWVGYTGSQGCIFAVDANGDGPYLYLNESTNGNTLGLYDGSTTTGFGGTLGTKAHFALNVSSSKVLTLYVNGAVYASDNVSPTAGQNFSLGCYPSGPISALMKGRVGKFAIYNTVLSFAQIQAHVKAAGL